MSSTWRPEAKELNYVCKILQTLKHRQSTCAKAMAAIVSNFEISENVFFFSLGKSGSLRHAQQMCQIFLGPNIPNWEKYNK
jgi:hypothetical protein